MLSNKEILEIIKKVRTIEDDYESYTLKESIFNEFLPIINSISKELKTYDFYEEDIFQEASIELLKAINEFDLESKTTFEDYVKTNIRNRVKEVIDDQREVEKISKYISNTLNKIIDTENKLYKTLKRKPKISDVIDKLDMEKDEYNEMKDYAITSLELDNSYKDDKYLISDLVALNNSKNDEPNDSDDEMIESLELSLKTLSDKEKDIITKHFGLYGREKMEIEDLALEYGISYEKMRQIISHIVRKIKMEMEE
ncbi:sigma-70 family RNA polymerase sigma factor [bacterium]|nr:sigma-70 family RNA polymerase sigma factor [bacterium]